MDENDFIKLPESWGKPNIPLHQQRLISKDELPLAEDMSAMRHMLDWLGQEVVRWQNEQVKLKALVSATEKRLSHEMAAMQKEVKLLAFIRKSVGWLVAAGGGITALITWLKSGGPKTP